MPYAVPSTSTSSSSVATTTASSSPPQSPSMRPGHRRTRSSFTDERGPGAFVSLGSLPRRRPTIRKAVFHINADDDSPPERDDDDVTSPMSPIDNYSLMNSLNTLRLSMDNNGSGSPSVSPPSHIDLPSQPAVPFPTSSPMPSPTHTMSSFMPSSPPRGTSLTRTHSSSITLSNGKPLKSSLKSSSSSPNIPGDAFRTKHLRAQSAPSTPNVHKNVHFADKDSGLESVRIFNRSGKPASLSKPPGDETETETEAENSTSSRGYPFPSFASSTGAGSSPSQPIIHEIDPAPGKTSPVPHPNPPLTANIHLETITLPRTRPPTLRGTVLVRNLTYEKNVAVRFTLDDWQTTSEVTCRHVVSLPGLPPPFPRPKKVVTVKKDTEGKEGETGGKEGEGKVVEEEKEDPNQPQWDRFSFTIRLEDYEPKLADRTLWLVARFSCPPSWNSAGGEWWDNNDGNNYRVSFRRAAVSPLATPTLVATSLPSFATSPSKRESSRHSGAPHPAPSLIANALAQQRSFNAPISLKYTPMTGTDAETATGSASADSSRLAPLPTLTRTMSSPYPSSSASGTGTSAETNPVPASPASSQPTAASSPSVATPVTPSGSSSTSAHPQPPHVRSPNSPPSPSAIHTSSYIKRRLSLSNYVAPSAPTKPAAHPSISLNGVGLATPPTTPPGSVRIKRMSPLPIVSREAEDFLSNTEENSEAEVSRRDYLEEAARNHVHEFEEVDDIVNSGQPVGDIGMGFGLQERDMKGRIVEGEGPAFGLPKLRWGVVGLSSESSESALSSSSSSSSSTDDLAGRSGGVKVKTEAIPFSPTGLTGKTPFPTMSFGGMSIGMGQGDDSDTTLSGLMSPPRSRETSEDGSGEGGRSSPTLQSTPPTVSSPAPTTLKSAFTPILGLFSHHAASSSSPQPSPSLMSTPSRSDAGSPFSTSSGSTTSVDTTPTLTAVTTPTAMLSPVSPIASLAALSSPHSSSPASSSPSRVDTSDSSYAAFVRQWCFAQSAPPTPGVTQGSTASPHVGSNAPTPPVPGGAPAPPSNGRGYGFPGFSFARGGSMLSGGHHHHLGDHAGVVGGE